MTALYAILEPGQECPTCNRRKPYPKKPASPTTKVRSYRVPLDEDEAHQDVLTETARFLGVYEQQFWQFKTLTMALGLVLQDESLRGFGQRGAA